MWGREEGEWEGMEGWRGTSRGGGVEREGGGVEGEDGGRGVEGEEWREEKWRGGVEGGRSRREEEWVRSEERNGGRNGTGMVREGVGLEQEE